MSTNDSRISSIVLQEKERLKKATIEGSTFNGTSQLVKTLSDGKLPVLDGSNLVGVSGITSVSYIAQDNITIYDIVTSDGRVANSVTISHRNKIIGIAKADTLIGFAGAVQGDGEITNPAWTWTIGDKIYLNNTGLSTIAPLTGFIQFIGTATASDKIDIKIGQSILL